MALGAAGESDDGHQSSPGAIRAGGHPPGVPTISRFHGIVVAMFFGDHPPPHIHVTYAEHQGRIAFRTGEVLTGDLPGRIVRMVVEWCELRRSELEHDWELAQAKLPLEQIEPLP